MLDLPVTPPQCSGCLQAKRWIVEVNRGFVVSSQSSKPCLSDIAEMATSRFDLAASKTAIQPEFGAASVFA